MKIPAPIVKAQEKRSKHAEATGYLLFIILVTILLFL